MRNRTKIWCSLLLAAGMVLSLTACGAKKQEGIALSGESITINDLALRPDGVAGRLYENDGMKLMIPLEYDELLVTETPQDSKDGLLFSVSERASILAAKAAGESGDGAGWLFGIGKIDEAALQEMLCSSDMSGREVFAKDAAGSYYVYYHPTDVRLVRESNEAMERDQELWTALNEWAWGSVRESFLAENTGLTAETRGSSAVDLYLARIAYMPGVYYTVSTTEFGPLAPEAGSFDAAPYVERLMHGVQYELAEDEEAPDGEYVVLSFPDDNMRFDFFLQQGKENIVRQVWSDGYEQLYRAAFADGETKASAVMQEWYDALAADRDMSQLGFTPDDFVGNWAEKIAGRGNITISRSEEAGKYDVQINWGASAFEMYVWTMTAEPAGSNMLRYENARHAILTFDDKDRETEELRYENGTGAFSLNSANELMWQDDMDHAGDDTVFISVGAP